MAKEKLPPACAFAVSVLTEYNLNPDDVPEEAVEAAEQHVTTCVRCLSNTSIDITALTGKKKKMRQVAESNYDIFAAPAREGRGEVELAGGKIKDGASTNPSQADRKTSLREPASFTSVQTPQYSPAPLATASAPIVSDPSPLTLPHPQSQPDPKPAPQTIAPVPSPSQSATDGSIDCQQCRQILSEYAEAMDSGQNVAFLYPEVQEHLLTCESGCLVLLDLFRQEAKANRKNRRRPVRDPFSVIGWEITGFFRGGQIPISPRALSFGTLIFLLLIASLSAYAGIRWDDLRYYHPLHIHTIPTPDGIGLSDGLKIYDACNASSYQYKREAAQAMQQGDLAKADKLLSSAVDVVDTTGCNSGEAAIYREDLHVRQSGRPFGIMVVSFDSGPGNADPQGGTDRHILYAAYTQELVGAFISQQQYNTTQMQTPGAPLLYLVLANTTGIEEGALQIANAIAALSTSQDLAQFGLLAHGKAPLLAVLGLGPSQLAQVVLPVLCRAGVPLLAPTTTGRFIIDLLSQTSLYRHCTPGFAFVRFSPDDLAQSHLGAAYAYNQLSARNAAVFYDPSNPSSNGSAMGFIDGFTSYANAHIVAQETAVASGLLDVNGRPQASREDLLAGLNDALKAKPRPDIIYAPLLTNDVITLAEAIAHLPASQQPILMIGGEFVQPAPLQGLVPWAREYQLRLPHIYIALSSATRPPTDGDWQKQFYASFCSSFATPGTFCSGAAALDQGALLFADGVELVAKGIGPIASASQLPNTAQLVQHMSKEHFAGVSSPIALQLGDNVLVTSTVVAPVVLGLQEDGSIQIVS
jgi:hypothetical protein